MQGTRAWRKSGRRREGADLADPQDLHGRVKAVLPEVQCPVGRHEAHWQSACRQCVHLRVKGARSHAPPRVRQGVVNPPNGTNGPPTPCYDVQYESSAGWPTGGEHLGLRSFRSSQRTGKPSTRAAVPTGEGKQVASGQGHEVREMRESRNDPAPYPPGQLESRMMRKYPVRFGRGPGEKAETSDLACGLPYPAFGSR